MTTYHLVLACTAAAGWALFVGSLAVLEAMHVKDGRWLSAAGWIGTALVGLWLGVAPQTLITAATWPVAVLAVTLAMVLWAHLQSIREYSARPARHRAPLPMVACLLLAGCLLAPALAIDTNTPRTWILTEAEDMRCEHEGGCALITAKHFRETVEREAKRLSSNLCKYGKDA